MIKKSFANISPWPGSILLIVCHGGDSKSAFKNTSVQHVGLSLTGDTLKIFVLDRRRV